LKKVLKQDTMVFDLYLFWSHYWCKKYRTPSPLHIY